MMKNLSKKCRTVESFSRRFLFPAVALMLSGLPFGASAEDTPKTLADVGSAEISEGAGVELVDRGDGTYALVFTNAQTSIFTFNSDWTVTEFLVVGGGGAGGGNGGAGGGGGGVIWYTNALLAADNVQTNFTSEQSVSLTVGAGGTGAFKSPGVPGGSSSLTIGGAVYTAFGGGGGGNYNDPPSVDRNAVPGVDGTGCGAAGYADGGTGVTTTMDPSKPGYYANNSGTGAKVSNQTYCAGGGGAGEVGGNAVTTGTKMGGKGGDGLPCPITGTMVYYAAGGGGSTSNPNTTKLEDEAIGGLGGGGHASAKGSRVGTVGIEPSDPSVHASGFGCGGGGGGGGSGACCFGGNGSAGIVVLAIYPTGSAPQEDDPDDPDPTVIDWAGAMTGDWDDPANWVGGVVPATGTVVRVSGTATISKGSETARIANATIEIGEDGSLTLVSGSVMPHPTLDVTRPVAGQALTVEPATFGGLSGDFSVIWARGSSMTSKSYQTLSTERSIAPTAADYEYWFRCMVKGPGNVELWRKEFFFSKLPVLYMTTDDGQTPSTKKEEHAGRVFVQGNETWASPYDGAMVIKMRGNTTTGPSYRKKPWKLKLGSKKEMFGIAKSKHWVLLANDKEKSAMRNKLAYDLANEIGSLGMESTWVECFLNGTYQGLYLFAEHIRVAKDRVDIFDWEGAGEDAADAIAEANGFTEEDTVDLETQMSENFAWVTSGKVTFKSVEYAIPDDFKNLDISGGYLVESSKEYDEVSKFLITSGTLTFESMLNSPEFLNTNSEMFNVCQTRVQDYLEALASPDGYNAKGQHWSQLADTDSMATYLLAIELFGNDDAEKKSRYFYWDVGGRIQFGPVWDFDWGVGNTLVDKTIDKPESWRAHNNNPRSFYREWTDDPWFCTRLRTLYWSKARDVLARMISDGGEVERYHDYLAEAAAANEVKWPNKADSGVARSFETDVTNLCTFLTTRLAWLDRQFADVPTLMESFKKSCFKEYSSRPDLDDLPSNCPYTADTDGLPISFPNAPTNVIAKGMALEMSAAIASGAVETVDVYVNGLKVGESLVPASGSVSAEIPAAVLSEAPGDDNCVALVARDGAGHVVSRNYALVRTVNEGVIGDGYTFLFEGEYAGDQTIAPTGTECVVIFNNATINGQLTLPTGVKAYFCPTNGTENSVGKIVGPDASVTLKDFDGLGGSVSLTGEDTLISISNLVVKSGTLDIISTGVSETKTPVVNVLGHVKQDGGVINLNLDVFDDELQIYGIYVANKDPKNASGEKMKIIYAEFNGGVFNATVGGWKSAALYINKGSVEATFNEGSMNNVLLTGSEARFVNASGDLNLKGGEFKVLMADEDISSIVDVRVFKSDKEIKIKGGHYDVNVPGPGAEIFSVSKNKDGDDSIITVKDGTFELVSDDDCFSADDRIDIQGGLFYAVSLNNDVFDSNGDMLVSGGTIMAYATAAGHEAFDVEPMVQGTEGSSFLPHRLTISGGTIFATGGKDAAWPENTVADVGVNLYVATEIDTDTISEKYVSIKGTQTIGETEDSSVVTSTAKLPAFPGSNGALLLTCPNMAEDAEPVLGDAAPTKGDQQFHDLYVSSNLPSNHGEVRIYEIYGSTAEGTPDVDFGDVGEYIVLTNVSDKVVQLTGLTVTSAKYDKKKDKIDVPKLSIELAGGTLAAGASIKLEQSDFTGKGWEKITNGTIYFQIIDDEGAVVQSGFGSFDNDLFPNTDGGGAALRAKRFDNETPLAATTTDWTSSIEFEPTEIIVTPAESATVEASDEEAAKNAVVFHVTVPVSDLGAPVVDEATYKGYFFLRATPVEGAAGQYLVEAVLNEGLVCPTIVSPFIPGADSCTVTALSKPGLYYSLLRGATLSPITDVRARKLADGDTVTLEDAAPLPDAAFYRVKVDWKAE